jgi:uncharacterized surface protein with fasciclin (FAS1) repeats
VQAFNDLLFSVQAASPNITLDQLLAPSDPQVLREILLYHLAPGAACVPINITTENRTADTSIPTALPEKSIIMT